MKKDTILTLIIGILIGAILTTAGFYIYEKSLENNIQETNQNEENGEMEFFDGEMPSEMPEGVEPPPKPEGEM